MIAKLARWHFAGRLGRLSTPVTAAPCNDNHPFGRSRIRPQRTLRRVPVCRWRVDPVTGLLECVWQMQVVKEPVEASADEDPALCRLAARGHDRAAASLPERMGKLRQAA